MDLECKGCSFTWSNKREGENLVKKRLDRAFCSLQWRVTYPEAECIALSAIGSDHTPLLISLAQPKRRKRKQFKYEAYWTDDAECKTIVRDTWNELALHDLNVMEKLQQVQQQLIQRSKSKFGHAKKRITWLKECQNLADILNQYCFASSQAINLNKSGIYFSKGCPTALKRNMATALRVPEITKTGKYLGIPLDWEHSKKDMFAWILARVNPKLDSWKEKLLSKEGKEILLKAVIQAIPQYAMSIFKIPISICKAIERKVASFWWKSNEKNAGIHWKKWDLLKTRKSEGGLGFKDLQIFNTTMLAKQMWRIIQNPDSLLTKILKGLYYSHCDIWNAGRGSRPSWG
ncbi:uncharacterized protein LOC104430535 [Eucalyptus grandis]|uniref:uncharacterized protein LOC104430535 n=1 Tax=Eucalyptus grandis TaxID=71139 RepID=UPI00192EAE3D|nr:uncharacterized protein LOC104430535 [Eucalyptus grandis]